MIRWHVYITDICQQIKNINVLFYFWAEYPENQGFEVSEIKQEGMNIVGLCMEAFCVDDILKWFLQGIELRF